MVGRFIDRERDGGGLLLLSIFRKWASGAVCLGVCGG